MAGLALYFLRAMLGGLWYKRRTRRALTRCDALLTTEPPERSEMPNPRLCSIPDCDKPLHARGWCNAHYELWRKHGDPMGGGTSWGEPLRYLSEVVLPYTSDECLPWPYSRDDTGYAIMRTDGRAARVSRLACEARHGPPPTPKHEAAHSCGKGHLGCVNQMHLDWKTHTENMADKLVHGTHNRGERCGSAKLTEADVLAIREMKGMLPHAEIARQYGICRQTIGLIHSGKRWAWLADK